MCKVDVGSRKGRGYELKTYQESVFYDVFGQGLGFECPDLDAGTPNFCGA